MHRNRFLFENDEPLARALIKRITGLDDTHSMIFRMCYIRRERET